MGNGFSLGKLFGIQFRLHYTWFIVFVLVVISLSAQYLPSAYPGWGRATYWTIGVIASLLFFASVVAHELAHSLVARVNGIPVRSITLFIFGGVAQITREPKKASTELAMSAAGPACSLVIGGLFGLVWLFTQSTAEPVAAMAFWLAETNGLLAVFNLIPGFPLDGGRVFRSVLWRFTGNYRRSTQIATQTGRAVGYLFILGGIALVFLLRDLFSGLWLAFVGWFLENAASASYRQSQWREGLSGLTAAQVMTTDFAVIAPDVTVVEVIQEHILAGGRRFFVVADQGKLNGVLTLHDIKSVPQQNWGTTRVREVMTAVDKLKVASPDQEVLTVLEEMVENDINQVPVVAEGGVVGLITRDKLLRTLPTRSE
jgi:Zn-dependent protease